MPTFTETHMTQPPALSDIPATVAAATESPLVQEAINLANQDIMGDIAHHLDWLESQRPGASVDFMKMLSGAASLTLLQDGIIDQQQALDLPELPNV